MRLWKQNRAASDSGLRRDLDSCKCVRPSSKCAGCFSCRAVTGRAPPLPALQKQCGDRPYSHTHVYYACEIQTSHCVVQTSRAAAASSSFQHDARADAVPGAEELPQVDQGWRRGYQLLGHDPRGREKGQSQPEDDWQLRVCPCAAGPRRLSGALRQPWREPRYVPVSRLCGSSRESTR